MTEAPHVGDTAPDFELDDEHGTPVSLSSLLAPTGAALLVFFPHAFTPTCDGELGALKAGFDDLQAASGPAGVQVAGICCDPTSALRAFAEQNDLPFPLLSDFWPHGEVSRRYGAFVEPRGFAMRASFLVDRDGLVLWSVVNGPGDARDVADYEAALRARAAR